MRAVADQLNSEAEAMRRYSRRVQGFLHSMAARMQETLDRYPALQHLAAAGKPQAPAKMVISSGAGGLAVNSSRCRVGQALVWKSTSTGSSSSLPQKGCTLSYALASCRP